MQFKEEIKTITSPQETRFKEKGSLFIGKAFPINNDDEFAAILASIKKEFYDATHHCYAYKLKDDTFKYSDAGEPNGTAGIRIFNAIEHFALVDVGVVIIRYYGGTKLGVGPLGKAYYKSAEDVLSSSQALIKKVLTLLTIKTSFDYLSVIHHHLPSFNAGIVDVQYSNDVSFTVEINPNSVQKLKDTLIEACSGQVDFSESGVIFYK